jgi:hypothetical protein
MSRSKLFLPAALILGWCFAAPGAMAQQSPGKPGTDQVIPEKRQTKPLEPPKPGRASSGQTLSEKLEKTNGVIKPPANMDPEIHKPTPNTGTMPVIPPPGTSGSQAPHVEPK